MSCPEASSRRCPGCPATHLYLIAPEAVHNAVKHAQAREVRVSLTADGGLVLDVRDAGVGMPARPAEHLGLGLRIMRNRAAVLGARLSIEPVQPSGTRVTCVLARTIEGGDHGSA
jgi:signal transduction histidine kinase